jgi:hypothetical protein
MTEVEEPVLPEEVPVAPPPPKKTLRRRKEAASPAAPATLTPEGHVSAVAFVFHFMTVLTRVAPEPTLGCLQPSVGLKDVRVFDCCFVSLS